MLWSIRPRFHGLSSCDGHVAHALRTRAPVAGNVLLHPAAPRLACVQPAASVHPEPGSNSSLLISFEPSRELTSRFLGFVVTPSLIYARPSRVQLGFWLISLFNELFAFAGAKLEIIFKPTKYFCVIFFPITPTPFSTARTAKILQVYSIFQIIFENNFYDHL